LLHHLLLPPLLGTVAGALPLTARRVEQ